MVITGFYAGILALIFLVLSMRVVMLRISSQTQYGDGGNEILLRRVRIHGNFAEYIPLALILMAILDYQNLSVTLLHFFGITLVVGRLLHAFALTNGVTALRAIGVVATIAVIAIEAILAIMHFVL